MNVAEEPISLQIRCVRSRPVGYMPGLGGGLLVAMERGYFPVSETGYRSLSGLEESATTSGFLEALAKERDRERERLVAQVRAAMQPEGRARMTYLYTISLADRAFKYGVFATDRDRAELWTGAHRLYSLIESDIRFQTASERSQWVRGHCANALSKVHGTMGVLQRWAKGEVPGAAPVALFSVRSYWELPPRPEGEPTIDFGAITPELGVGIAGTTARVRRARPVRSPAPHSTPGASGAEKLGLYGGRDSQTPGNGPRRGLSI